MSENQKSFVDLPVLEDGMEPPVSDESFITYPGVQDVVREKLSSLKESVSLEAQRNAARNYKAERAAGNEKAYNAIIEGAGAVADRFTKKTLGPAQPFDEESVNQRANFPNIGITSTTKDARFDLELLKAEKEGENKIVSAIQRGMSEEYQEGSGEFEEFGLLASTSTFLGSPNIYGPSALDIAGQVPKAILGGTQETIYEPSTDTTKGGALSTIELFAGFFTDFFNFVSEEGQFLVDTSKALYNPEGIREGVDQNPFAGKGSLMDVFGPYFAGSPIPVYKKGKVEYISGYDKMWADISNLRTAAIGAHDKAIERQGKGFNDAFKTLFDSKKSIPMAYSDIRREYLEVPFRFHKDSGVIKFASRFGMALPWAGLHATTVGGKVIYRNLTRGMQGVKLMKETGFTEGLKAIPFRKMMLDGSIHGKLPPDSVIAIMEKYDMDAMKFIKSYKARGMNDEQALRYRRNVRADFIGSIGAASGMGIVDVVFGEDSPLLSVLGSVGGYLAANPAFRIAKTNAAHLIGFAGRGVSSVAQIGRLIPDEDFIAILANSQSSLLTPFRKSVLYAKGFDDAEIKTLMDKSLEIGQRAIGEIRAASTNAEKNRLLVKYKNEKVFSEATTLKDFTTTKASPKAQEKGQVSFIGDESPPQDRGRYFSRPGGFYYGPPREGAGTTHIPVKVNPYSQLIKLYRTDKKSMQLVAGFKNYIANLAAHPDPKKRAQALDINTSIRETIKKVDQLTASAPTAMRDFPLFFDQMTGLASLHTLRAQLMQTAQYSVAHDGFISGGIISELEAYNKLHLKQSESLLNTMQEMKKQFNASGKSTPEEVVKSMNLVQEELLNPWTLISEQAFTNLKNLAQSPQMQKKLGLIQAEKGLRTELGLNTAGGTRSNAENGAINERLFADAFTAAHKKVTDSYASLKAAYGDDDNYSIIVGDSLKSLGDLSADTSLPAVNQYLKLYAIPRNLAAKMTAELSTKTFGKAIEGLSPEEQVKTLKAALEDNLLSSGYTPASATKERDDLLKKLAGDSDEQTVKNIISYFSRREDAPAAMSFGTFLEFKRELNSQLGRAYRAKDFNRSRVLADKLDELNGLFKESFDVGDPIYKALEEAENVFKNVMVPYREIGSPLMKIKSALDKTGKPVEKYEYFNLFLEEGAITANVDYFKKAYFDPDNPAFEATGGYNPEAIEQLKLAMGLKLIGGREGRRQEYTASNLEKYANPINKFKERTIEPFEEVLTSANQDSFVNNIYAFADYYTRESRDVAVAYEAATPLLTQALTDLKTELAKRLEGSAAQRFGSSAESLRPEVFSSAARNQKPSTMEEVIDLLLSKDSGDSITSMAGGGAEGFISRIVFGGDTRLNELLAKRKSNTLEVTDNIGQAATNTEITLLSQLDEGLFKSTLDSWVTKGGQRSPQTPFIEILLDMIPANKKEEMRKSLGTIILDEWIKRSFPPVTKTSRTVELMPLLGRAKLDELVENNLASSRQDALTKIAFDDPAAMRYLRANDPNFNKSDFTEYSFNMGVELDMFGANTFFKDNEQTFKILFGEEHFKAFSNLTEVINIVSNQLDSVNIGNIPKSYTTAMLLGRVYNMLKGVVSPRYLLGEKVIMDYRLNQANLLKDVLSDERTSKALIDVFRHDTVYDRKAIKKVAQSIILKAAALGFKTKNVEEYAKDLEKNKLYIIKQGKLQGKKGNVELEQFVEDSERKINSTSLGRMIRGIY